MTQPATVGGDTVRFRSPYADPAHDGEEREAIVWMAYDVEEGVEHGVMPYTRRAGKPVFVDPAEMVSIALDPAPAYRGSPCCGTCSTRTSAPAGRRPRTPNAPGQPVRSPLEVGFSRAVEQPGRHRPAAPAGRWGTTRTSPSPDISA
jgi:hypothetical protein